MRQWEKLKQGIVAPEAVKALNQAVEQSLGNDNRLIGGTLKERFLEPEYAGKIYAKTGYIHEVNCLSGYVTGMSGKDYIFSIMLEGREDGIPFLDEGLKGIIRAI